MIHKRGLYTPITSLPWLITDSGLGISCGWSCIIEVPTLSWSLQLWTTYCGWEVYCTHSFGWVVDCIFLYGDHCLELCLLWRPLVHASHCATFCGRNNLCPTCLFSIIKTCLSNIRFWYGVFISPSYSSPFSRFYFVCFSMIYWFASKSNCRCKYRVTIQLILFDNHLSLESIDYHAIFMASITYTFNIF